MKKLSIFFLLIALLQFTGTHAQTYGVDPSFNANDVGFGNGDAVNSNVFTSALQSDGKIIIGGVFTAYHNVARNYIARLKADGSLDDTFNVGTGASSSVFAVAIQSDGKIIIGGYFTAYNGTTRNHLARLNTDGSLDATFNIGTGTDDSILTIAIQSDGKIIIGGYFTTYNGTSIKRIARLNTNGSLDATFVVGTGADNDVMSSAIQSDGKILIGGYFSTYNGVATDHIIRLNTNGSRDATFNTGGVGVDNTVSVIVIQSNGKIMIGGFFSSYNSVSRNSIARLNTDGTLDTSFTIGTGGDDSVTDIAIQSDGKIIIGGRFTTFNGSARNYIARLTATGSLDATFNVGTGAQYEDVSTILVQSDGKTIIAGLFRVYNGKPANNIARLNTDGTLDNTFIGVGTGVSGSGFVNTVAIQSDGKIIIGGYFNAYNGISRNGIARLNTDGSFDATFNIGTGIGDGAVLTTVMQSNGKIIFGGDFTVYNETPVGNVGRLNTNGSLDATFNVAGEGPDSLIYAMALQSDGKIIIGGNFAAYNGTPRKYLTRLNSDGSLDATFAIGTGPNNQITTLAIQKDGKIIIGGDFTTYNGTPRNRIARLNTNGSLDATFNVGTGLNNSIIVSTIQNDGKIIIGGDFTTYNGTSRNRLVRLNTDGSLDATFNVGTGADDIVGGITFQSDGKIIISGDLTTYNGTSRNRIARINSDGSLDATFTVGTGGDDSIITTAIQSDGNIIIGGAFTSFNSVGRNRIARLIGVVTENEKMIVSNTQLAIYPNPSNGTVTIQSTSEGFYSILNDIGQSVQTFELNDFNNHTMNIENLNQGIYFITAFNKNKIASQKIVVTK